MVTKFPFGVLEKFWKQIVVVVAQQCELNQLLPLNYTLKNG